MKWDHDVIDIERSDANHCQWLATVEGELQILQCSVVLTHPEAFS